MINEDEFTREDLTTELSRRAKFAKWKLLKSLSDEELKEMLSNKGCKIMGTVQALPKEETQ